jgi:hypothetical protein
VGGSRSWWGAVNAIEKGEGVLAIGVHSRGAADTFVAGTVGGSGRVELAFDFDGSADEIENGVGTDEGSWDQIN